jgi:Flp pilus assembly protein TadD
MIRRLGTLLFAILALEGCNSLPNAASNPSPSILPAGPEISADDVTADTGALYLSVVEGLNKQQRYGAALAFLDSYAHKGGTSTPQYWLLRGNALLGQGRASEAGIAFANLEGSPLAGDGWNGCGRVAAQSRNWAKAEVDFQKAVGQEPANADFLNNLAFADMHLNQRADSVARLRQAYELEPDSERIRNNLAIALTLKGDANSADALLSSIRDDGKRREAQALVKKAIANFNSNTGDNS